MNCAGWDRLLATEWHGIWRLTHSWPHHCAWLHAWRALRLKLVLISVLWVLLWLLTSIHVLHSSWWRVASVHIRCTHLLLWIMLHLWLGIIIISRCRSSIRASPILNPLSWIMRALISCILSLWLIHRFMIGVHHRWNIMVSTILIYHVLRLLWHWRAWHLLLVASPSILLLIPVGSW